MIFNLNFYKFTCDDALTDQVLEIAKKSNWLKSCWVILEYIHPRHQDCANPKCVEKCVKKGFFLILFPILEWRRSDWEENEKATDRVAF
jgi:hypothetical protein